MKYPRYSFNAQRGFSLLEMIVALALSSLVAMIGAMALNGSIDSFTRSNARRHNHEQFQATERALRVEWSNRGKSRVLLAENAIEFDANTPVLPAPRAGVARVRYACEKADDGSLRLRSEIVSPKPAASATNEAAKNGQAVPASETWISNLKECEITAFQRTISEKGQVSAQWVKAWSDKIAPPELIRLNVQGEWGRVPPMVFLIHKLP